MGNVLQLLKKAIIAVALIMLFFTAFTTAQVSVVLEMLGGGLENIVNALTSAVGS